MIDRIENHPIRLDRTERTGAAEEKEAGSSARPHHGDTVEISAEARARAMAADEVEGLSAERLAEIRRRMADGTYNTPEVLEAVARAIIERGDV